ncbi:MAG: DUF6972 family protein, partial [Aphanizomenon sp.]
TDGESDQLNKSLNSRAFATGQDIFFSQGAYNPGSRDGQELLAHELTHVVQQNGGVQRKIVQHQTTEQKIVQMMPKVKSGNLSVKDAQIALAKANKELAFELAQTAADIAGIVDPTPISDGISAAMSLAKGDYFGAGLSIVSMIPYLGDTIGKPIKAARNGKKILKLRKEIAELIQIIEKLSPAGRKASAKTKDAVAQEMKQVLKPTLGNTKKKTTPKSLQDTIGLSLSYEIKHLNKHLRNTLESKKLINKDGSAHVFNNIETLSKVESEILRRGQYTGTVRDTKRYGLRFKEAIGSRIAKDGTEIPLHYGELKVRPDGQYHIIPRTGPSK